MKRLISILCIVSVFLLCFSGLGTATALENTISLGDPNKDETINAADALIVLQLSVDKVHLTPLQESACDVNSSETVDAADALQILQYSVNKISGFSSAGLKGMTLTMGSVYAGKYTANTDYGKAFQQALDAAEQVYGVEIIVEPIDLAEDKDNLWTYDLLELPVANARALAKEGLLMDLSQVATLDMTVLDSGSTGSCAMGDTLYGVASPAMSANPMGLAINADLLERYAPVSYAKLAEQFANGTWTWEALNALVAEYRQNAADSAVMISNTNIIGQAIVANAGYEVAFLEDGSGAVSSIATDEGIAALQYVKEFYNSGAFWYETDVAKMYEAFKEQQVPMAVYYLNDVAAVAGGNFALTAMPFPKGPSQEDYVMCTFNSSVFSVPAGAATYGNAYGLILNAMASADEAIADGTVALGAGYGYDTLGQAVYRWATKNTSKDFSTGPFTGAVGGPVDGSVLNPEMNPYVAIPKISDLIQAEVDAYYGQFYKK